MEETISLYAAIAEMRYITSQGGFFTFMHATYNRDKHTTNGIREVKRAKLRPAANGDDIANADYKLFYHDDIFREDRNCWQMLIMFFNGKKVVLT
jgi:hypothetical protein